VPSPPIPLPNPLENLGDVELFKTQLTLALACGRAKASLRQKHRQHICFLFEVLKLEADKRGKPTPRAPFVA